MNAKSRTKEANTCCGSQRVGLQLTWPGARQVSIAGSFNDWHTSVTPMICLSDGKWAKELSLAPGCHEYRFVVDGEWVDDPAATARLLIASAGLNTCPKLVVAFSDNAAAVITSRYSLLFVFMFFSFGCGGDLMRHLGLLCLWC